MTSSLDPNASLVLSPTQMRRWLAAVDAMPEGVRTVGQLSQWTEGLKARIEADEPDHRTRASQLACVDALFELCVTTGVRDAKPQASRAIDAASKEPGWRLELESQLVTLVATGRGDTQDALAIKRRLA
jgi:hypothetical protein